LVDDNAMVRVGTPLFRIDPFPYQLRVELARAKWLEAKEQGLGSVANLYVAREAQNRAESSLLVASQAVQNATADLAVARSSTAKVEAQLKLADADVARATQLIDGNAISREEFEQRVRTQAVYQSELEEARQREIKARAGIEVARAEVVAAEASIREARAQRAKALSLVDPTEALQNSIANLEGNLASAKSAAGRGDDTLARQQIADLESELDLFRAWLQEAAVQQPELKGRLAAVVQAEDALRFAEYELDQTTVRASADGVVTNFQLTVGTFASPAKPIAALIDSSQWRLVAPVPESWLSRVNVGDEVRIALRNYPLSFRQGKVQYIRPGVIAGQGVPGGTLPDSQSRLGRVFDTPERSQEFQVIISLDDDRVAQPLRVGGTAHAVIYASGGLPGVNQIASLLCSITSFMDCFVPKPSLMSLLILIGLLLSIVALVRFIQRPTC
jgi:multidrug resistance efflux pump